MPGKSVEIVHLGAATVASTVLAICVVLLARFRPDIIVIYEAPNDLRVKHIRTRARSGRRRQQAKQAIFQNEDLAETPAYLERVAAHALNSRAPHHSCNRYQDSASAHEELSKPGSAKSFHCC
jgi:hypothetical protein